jgi:uncharacterized protein YkwD
MYKKIALLSIISIFSINGCSSATHRALKAPQKRFANVEINSNKYLSSQESNEVLSYINSIRNKGAKCAPPAPPLYSNGALERAAISHSKDMAINNFLQHNGSGTELDAAKPKGALHSTFVDRITYYGYPVKPNLLVGENITFTKFKNTKSSKFSDNYKKAVDNWLNDEQHCKILMNPRFTYAGVGYQKTRDKYYFTLDLAEKNVAK